jgi:hypothetical protein
MNQAFQMKQCASNKLANTIVNRLSGSFSPVQTSGALWYTIQLLIVASSLSRFETRILTAGLSSF